MHGCAGALVHGCGVAQVQGWGGEGGRVPVGLRVRVPLCVCVRARVLAGARVRRCAWVCANAQGRARHGLESPRPRQPRAWPLPPPAPAPRAPPVTQSTYFHLAFQGRVEVWCLGFSGWGVPISMHVLCLVFIHPFVRFVASPRRCQVQVQGGWPWAPAAASGPWANPAGVEDETGRVPRLRAEHAGAAHTQATCKLSEGQYFSWKNEGGSTPNGL